MTFLLIGCTVGTNWRNIIGSISLVRSRSMIQSQSDHGAWRGSVQFFRRVYTVVFFDAPWSKRSWIFELDVTLMAFLEENVKKWFFSNTDYLSSSQRLPFNPTLFALLGYVPLLNIFTFYSINDIVLIIIFVVSRNVTSIFASCKILHGSVCPT